MQTIELQRTTFMRGAQNSQTPLIQHEYEWADCGSYTDAVGWIDVKQQDDGGGGSGITFNIQTSPTRDESCFLTMGTVAINGQNIFLENMFAGAAVPLAKYVRWQFFPTANPNLRPWHLCFRVYLAVSMPRRRRKMSAGGLVMP